MGLARRVAEHRAALGHHRGHERVLGAGDAGLVEEDVGAGEALGLELVAVAHHDGGAELLQREEMGVHPAPADDVAARRGQGDRAEPREHRAGQQDRRADLGAERRVERLGAQRPGCRPARVFAAVHSACAPRSSEQREHRLDVADAGDVVELDDAVGEHGGGEDRERGVLVAGGADGAAQRTTAADEKARRHGQSCRGRLHASSGARGLRRTRDAIVFTGCDVAPGATRLFRRMRDA